MSEPDTNDNFVEEFSNFIQTATEDEAKRWLVQNMDRLTEDEQKEILFAVYQEQKLGSSDADMKYEDLKIILKNF